MKKEILNNEALTVRVNAEPVVDEVEKVVDAVQDQITTVAKNNPYVLVGVGVAALAVGGFVGYKVCQRRLSTKYEELIKQETAEIKQYYSVLNKKDEYDTPAAAAEARGLDTSHVWSSSYVKDSNLSDAIPSKVAEEAFSAVRKYGGDPKIAYNKIKQIEPEEAPIVNNVFVDNEPIDENDFDYDVELTQRDPETPYIITKEEFMGAEKDYNQTTITYYVKDDTLSDERDDIIADSDLTVGDQNLMRFGHGSGDNNVVYVRNEKLEIEFEIVKSRGSYAAEVGGFIEHSSDKRGLRKFRNDADE